MRIVSILLGLLLLAASPVARAEERATANAPIADKWALIIGISKYTDPGINLRYADKDAQDFRDFLVKRGNFAQDHIKLILNEEATRARILDYMGDKWLPRVAKPGDLVVIYISSHGSPSHADVAGANFLVAHDTDPDHLFATGISMQELASIIKERVHSDRVVLFLDACHSGAVQAGRKGLFRQKNFDATDIMQSTGQLVVCSSAPEESSWESKVYDNSVFTRQLIDALYQNGTSVNFGTAFGCLRDRVREEVLRDRGMPQNPVVASKWQGNDLIILDRPANPRPVPDLPTAEINSQPNSVKSPAKQITPDIATLKALAQNKRDCGQYGESTRLYESLRKVLESTVGRDTDETTDCLTQLGWLYMVQGRYRDAESLQRESVRINTTLYGDNSFFVARELTLLCNTMLSANKFSEAEPIALHAIEAWKALGGADNPNILESYVNLGTIRTQQKKYKEAQQLFEHATRLSEMAGLEPANAHRIKLETNFKRLRRALN